MAQSFSAISRVLKTDGIVVKEKKMIRATIRHADRMILNSES